MTLLQLFRTVKDLADRVADLPGLRSCIRIIRNLGEKNVTLVAGGVAFYAFLAIFPGILSVLLLWGLLASDRDVFTVFDVLSSVLPEQSHDIIATQMTRLMEQDGPASPLAAALSLFIALLSSSRAIEALLLAIHMMYRTPYRRGMIKQRGIALGFTLSGIVFVILSVFLIGAVPPVLSALSLDSFAEAAVLSLRWGFILVFFAVGAYAFYFVSRAPEERPRTRPRAKLFPGTLAASLIWLLASFGFSYALPAFINYDETFGSLGAVAALMIWLWVSALALLIGAEINTDYEGKTVRALERQKAAESPIPPTI